MYHPHIHLIPRKNSELEDFYSWVVLVYIKSGTEIEKELRCKNAEIYQILQEQNINYSEITTYNGRMEVYDRFNFQNGKPPLFYVFNKHPDNYRKDDTYMVIEWGKWRNINIDDFKNDLMTFVNFFSNEDFRKKIAGARDLNSWKRLLKFMKLHGLDFLKMGVSIGLALF